MSVQKLAIGVVLVSLLAGCNSPKPKVASGAKGAPVVDAPWNAGGASSAAGTAATPTPAPVETNSAPLSTESAPVAAPLPPAGSDPQLNDPHSLLSKRSIYYPVDVSVVQDADKPVVQAHAQYLRQHATRKMRVEGNCDERGSNEYNLALGQRRADGIKKMLVAGGVKESQVESISFGEEKPKAAGHDDASWAENRRADLNYNVR
ncbi:MAG: peptidoglycan-associated lipoprotein Pal [Pseudomonadota bacterium]